MQAVLGPQVLFGLLQALSDPFRAVSVGFRGRKASNIAAVPQYGPLADVKPQSRPLYPVAITDVRGSIRSPEGKLKEIPRFVCFPGY